jgi:hypothetical protein
VAAACLTLLRDAQERQRLASLARERVIQLFTLERSLEAFRLIYDQVATEHRTVVQQREVGQAQ